MREYKRICLTVSAPKRPFCVNEPNSRKFVDIRGKKYSLRQDNGLENQVQLLKVRYESRAKGAIHWITQLVSLIRIRWIALSIF